MTFIKDVNLASFLLNQNFGFHTLAIAETRKCNDAKLTDLQTVYDTKYNAYDEVLKISGKSASTQPIADADKLQDDMYRGLASQNKVMQKHFDPVYAEIARQVDIILNKYGNPCKLPYLQEDSVLKNLVQDLEVFNNHQEEDDRPVIESIEEESPLSVLENVTNRLEKIGLWEWLVQLKAANAKFAELYAARNEQDATIITGATKAAGLETDQAYYNVVRRINSLADINGTDNYKTVINNINQLIDKEHASLTAHRTTVAKRNKKKQEGDKDDDRPVID